MGEELQRIYKKFSKECSLLSSLFETTIVQSTVNNSSRIRDSFIREMCVIRLHDSWSRFCRELVLRSAGSRPRTVSGSRLNRSQGVKRYRDVIPVLISTYPRRRTEPAWHNPTECLDAARRLGVSNYSSISQGLSLSFNGSAPTTQLTAVRNYFAHRNLTTAAAMNSVAQGLFISPVPQPYDLVAVTQSGTTLFALWVLRLKQMAQLSVQ